MTQISNADKQARFRKKEWLKREADKILRKWELSPMRWRSNRSPEEVRLLVEKAIVLPSGWTNADFEFAQKKLGQCQIDLSFSVDQLANDVNGEWASRHIEFMSSPDPVKYIADNKAVIEKARALSTHLISALNLSNCNEADQAAALMEAVRFTGRSLANDREIHCSQATAMCLAMIGPQYDRPKWFAKKLADAIRTQLGDTLAQEVANFLCSKDML